MHPNSGPRRRHSDELKARVLAACDAPGASISGVALTHGLNTNLVRKWRSGRGFKPAGTAITPAVPNKAASPGWARACCIARLGGSVSLRQVRRLCRRADSCSTSPRKYSTRRARATAPRQGACASPAHPRLRNASSPRCSRTSSACIRTCRSRWWPWTAASTLQRSASTWRCASRTRWSRR